MTVKEAALEVLRAAGRPLNVAEILAGIETGNLFRFATSGKRGVVLAALKRHAENAHSCSPAKEKVFRQVGEDRFEVA
jgi:20S proteasome alpha/beta subunit